MSRVLKKLPAFSLPLVAALVLLGACAGPVAPGEPSRPSPQEIMDKSQAAMENLRSYRSTTTVATTRDGQTTEASTVTEFVSPDRTHTVITDQDGRTETITIGDAGYELPAGSDTWQAHEWPGSYYGVASRRVEANVAEAFGRLVGVTEPDDEKIDGVVCYHYRGSEDMKARAAEQRAQLDPSAPGYDEQLKMAELQREWKIDVEYWVAKEGFLLRQLRQTSDMVLLDSDGGETEREVHLAARYSVKYYDFNADIKIEAPAKVEGVNLIANATSSAGGSEDIEHQVARYEIVITNQGTETARDIKVFVDTSATNDGLRTFEATPSQGPVTLGPGQSANYTVSWEFNLALMGKPKFVELIQQDVLRARWVGEDGQTKERALLKGWIVPVLP